MGNVIWMLVSLVGIVCGVHFLNSEQSMLVGRWWDAFAGMGILGNAIVLGANFYGWMTGDEE